MLLVFWMGRSVIFVNLDLCYFVGWLSFFLMDCFSCLYKFRFWIMLLLVLLMEKMFFICFFSVVMWVLWISMLCLRKMWFILVSRFGWFKVINFIIVCLCFKLLLIMILGGMLKVFNVFGICFWIILGNLFGFFNVLYNLVLICLMWVRLLLMGLLFFFRMMKVFKLKLLVEVIILVLVMVKFNWFSVVIVVVKRLVVFLV